MALSAAEEAQTRELLAQQAAILSLADSEATIISKLGATKVNLSQLPAATSVADADLLLLRQGTTDKSVAGSIVKAYAGTVVPDASETVKGIVELATVAETIAGTDTTRAVHPAGLMATKQASSPVRQTVSTGATTAGAASFLSAGSGLSVNLSATAVPVTVSYAYGFGLNGAIDYVSQYLADAAAAWSALTANATLFLYSDRNASTGSVTQGFSALVPAYSTVAPSAPATDQHWFDLTSWQMKRWSGSAWVAVQRVFIGEAVTGASTVTSVATYALNGRYVSADVTWPTTATAVSLTTNIGVQPPVGQNCVISVKVEAVCQTAEFNYSIGDVVEPFCAPSVGTFCQLTPWKRRNTAGFTTGYYTSLNFIDRVTGWAPEGTIANWKYRVSVQRGF